MSKIIAEQIGDRRIAIKGVGVMFYQDGFPISLSISYLKEMGIEVSIMHVADECLKHGWSAKTTYNKLINDFQDDIDGNKLDFNLLEKFCYSSYEDQREMIFYYLFGGNTEHAITMAKEFIQHN